MEIKIKYHGVEPIKFIEVGDWIDLSAAKTVELKAGEHKYIPLGVSIELPAGYEAYILPRSSTFKSFGLLQANSMAVIDNSYCGDNDIWHFSALAMRDTTIQKGDRICQFRIARTMKQDIKATLGEDITFKSVDTFGDATRGRGGFGSTGRN